jgi:hypothetical protein
MGSQRAINATTARRTNGIQYLPFILWGRSIKVSADDQLFELQGCMARAKSTLILILDQLPLKPDAPYSVALLRHYVDGRPKRLRKRTQRMAGLDSEIDERETGEAFQFEPI